MEKTVRGFSGRSFSVLIMVFTGLGLPLTGYANHVYGFSPKTVARHAWMAAHNSLGILFAVFAIVHVVLNRRVLWRYLKDAAGQASVFSREAVVAGAVVGLVLVLAVGHAFHF